MRLLNDQIFIKTINNMRYFVITFWIGMIYEIYHNTLRLTLTKKKIHFAVKFKFF